MKKVVALILAFSNLLSLSLSAAGLFNTYFTTQKNISDSLSYVSYEGENDAGKKQRVYMLDYTPSTDTLPVVSWGNSLLSRKTLSSMLKAQEGAVAGVNADFFSFYTGIPMGAVISDGILVSSDAGAVAVGIKADGSVIVGKPNMKLTLSYTPKDPLETDAPITEEPIPEEPIPEEPIPEEPEEVLKQAFESTAHFNKYPTIWNVYITNGTYSDSTASEIPSLEFIVSSDKDIKLGESAVFTIDEIFTDALDTPIPEGKLAVTVPNSFKNSSYFEQLEIGDTLTFTVTADEGWSECTTVFSGGDIIVENSVFVPESVNEDHEKYRNARTAVGIRDNGTVFFVCVDYTDKSSGMTLSELADFMIGEGAVTAVNLDGGGSTVIAAHFLDEENVKVVNTPSEKTERQISNAVLFVNRSKEVNLPVIADFSIDKYVLSGSSVEINPTFYSSDRLPLIFVPNTSEYTVSNPLARVENGVYYSVADAGYTERIFGKFVFGDLTLESEFVLNVTDTLDELSFDKSAFVVKAGDTLTLSLTGTRYGRAVSTPVEVLSFSIDDTEILVQDTEDAELLLDSKYFTLDKNGTLTVLEAPLFTQLKVSAAYKDRSDVVTLYFGRRDEVIEAFDDATLFVDAERKASAKGYRTEKALASADSNFAYKTPVTLDIVPEYFTVSIKGGYDDTLYVALQDSTGKTTLLPYYVHKNYSSVSGWCELIAPVTTAFEGEVKLIAPVTSEGISIATVDSFTSHYGWSTDPFVDIEGIWSHDYITDVYDMGLINGYSENGELIFKPDNYITRAEFSKMLVSYLGLDTQFYFNYGSDFADAEMIPEWAREYVRAVSVEEYMNGRLNSDGTLTFDASSYITRAEAMKVFSQLIDTLPETADLPFTDEALVPEWAREAVLKVVCAGIITGFDDGTIRASDNITRAQMCVMFTRLWALKNS